MRMVFLDRFIEPSLKLDSDQLYRARVLVAAVLAFTIILFTVALYLLTLAPIAASSALWSTLLVTLLNCVLIGVLGVLKTRGHYELCAHITCGATMLSIATGITVSGGPLLSPATPISVVTIILAFVLSGRRIGLTWTAVVLVTHALMLILLQVLGPFPQWLYMGYAGVHHVMHWIVTYVAIVGLMLIFDSINARLKRERDAERSRFEYLASHDPLTQLANRHVFDDRLRIAVARARRRQHSVALFFIDLNGFKPINDKYGHEMGDRVLQVIAARLQTHFRNVDTVARLGGDEFAILIEDLQDDKRVPQLAQKIVNLLGDPIESLPPEIRLGGSIGVALCPQHAQDEEKLVQYADTAMYQAKRNRDDYRIFDPAMLVPLRL
jgi:diguanylate cyclase (GGDEF)-like protein